MPECVHGFEQSQCAICSAPPPPRAPTTEEVHREFLESVEIGEAGRERADRLAEQYAQRRPAPDPKAVAFREEYARHFSEEGLERVTGAQLRHFANSGLVAHPGNMSNFNDEWNRLGYEDARARVVEAISYLLYGPSTTRLEDRLTDLIEGSRGMGFRGLKESLLTKVLCMVEPQRFLPILIYTSPAGKGKKEIAEAVFHVHFPKPERLLWQIGRMVIWSNDRLIELLPERFRSDLVWAADFLWWAKDEPWTGAAEV